jgi:hypothetical protein
MKYQLSKTTKQLARVRIGLGAAGAEGFAAKGMVR